MMNAPVGSTELRHSSPSGMNADSSWIYLVGWNARIFSKPLGIAVDLTTVLPCPSYTAPSTPNFGLLCSAPAATGVCSWLVSCSVRAQNTHSASQRSLRACVQACVCDSGNHPSERPLWKKFYECPSFARSLVCSAFSRAKNNSSASSLRHLESDSWDISSAISRHGRTECFGLASGLNILVLI